VERIPLTAKPTLPFEGNGAMIQRFLIQADDSELPLMLSAAMNDLRQLHPVSKVNISFHIASIFTGLFCSFHNYSSHSFLHELLFNCSERKTGSIVSHTINKGARRDTLLIASGCTLLIGEDNCSSLQATESILEEDYASFFNVASLNVQHKLKMFRTP
jgi:hypothetical protein